MSSNPLDEILKMANNGTLVLKDINVSASHLKACIQNPNITEITIDGITLDVEKAKTVTLALQQASHLKSLTLYRNHLTVETAKILFYGLEVAFYNNRLPLLEYLDFSHNSLSGDYNPQLDLELLVALIFSSGIINKVKTLILKNNGLTRVWALMGYLETNGHSLEILDLGDNQLHDFNWENINNMLKANSVLRKLSFRNNLLGGKGRCPDDLDRVSACRKILVGFNSTSTSNSKLEELDLGGNRLSDGFEEIEKSCCCYVYKRINRFNSEALGQALFSASKNAKLKKVWLDNNDFTPAGIQALLKGFSGNPNLPKDRHALEMLTLQNKNITPAQEEQFLKTIGLCTVSKVTDVKVFKEEDTISIAPPNSVSANLGIEWHTVEVQMNELPSNNAGNQPSSLQPKTLMLSQPVSTSAIGVSDTPVKKLEVSTLV